MNENEMDDELEFVIEILDQAMASMLTVAEGAPYADIQERAMDIINNLELLSAQVINIDGEEQETGEYNEEDEDQSEDDYPMHENDAMANIFNNLMESSKELKESGRSFKLDNVQSSEPIVRTEHPLSGTGEKPKFSSKPEFEKLAKPEPGEGSLNDWRNVVDTNSGSADIFDGVISGGGGGGNPVGQNHPVDFSTSDDDLGGVDPGIVDMMKNF